MQSRVGAERSNSASIVLVAYHGDDWLPECIASLLKASEQRLHLILVDNAGNRRLDRISLDGFRAEVLRCDRPLGFAEANNFALVNAASLGSVVVFLNQDTISTPGWIDACLDALSRGSHFGAVSPLIRTYDDDGWDPSFVSCLSAEQQSMLERSATDQCMVVENAPAPALLVRTDVLERTGPFDPIFGSYYEDYDLCRRIRNLGFRIGFVSGARIRHFSGSTTTTRERELARMQTIIRNRFIYQIREAGGDRVSRIIRHFAFAFPRRLARGILRTTSSQPPSVTLRAYLDIVGVLPRLYSASRDRAAWMRYLDDISWSRTFQKRRQGIGAMTGSPS